MGDLLDEASLVAACDGVEVVYHIAATYRTAGQPDTADAEFALWGEPLREELFDLAADPREERSVHTAAAARELRASLHAPLQALRRMCPGDGATTAPNPAADEQLGEALRALGYVE